MQVYGRTNLTTSRDDVYRQCSVLAILLPAPQYAPAISNWSDFDDCHDCIAPIGSLYVHLIMSQANNGQSLSEKIDWPGLRAAVGIRKAARHAARDLPPDEQERFIQR